MIAADRVYDPGCVDELVAAMREADSRGERLAAIGGETAIDLGNAPSGLDAVVRMSDCAGVIAYEPPDQTITVCAGTTLEELQRVSGEHGQRLALDPPRPDRATIGGIIATNAFGPLRTRYGTMRDLILGVTIVRADGTLARGGGTVVKNVAGFDLPKLMVGSLGTLGVVATATLRLHPRPEATCGVLVRGLRAGEVRVIARAMRELALEPAACTALAREDHYDLHCLFEGFASGAAAQAARLREHAHRCGLDAALAGETERAPFTAEHASIRTSGDLRLAISAPRSRFEELHALVVRLCRALGSARFAWYPLAGCGFLAAQLAPTALTPFTANALSVARCALEALGGTLVMEAAPAQIRLAIDAWGTPPASLAIMRRIKDRFDPQRRLNPGRFVGGL